MSSLRALVVALCALSLSPAAWSSTTTDPAAPAPTQCSGRQLLEWLDAQIAELETRRAALLALVEPVQARDIPATPEVDPRHGYTLATIPWIPVELAARLEAATIVTVGDYLAHSPRELFAIDGYTALDHWDMRLGLGQLGVRLPSAAPPFPGDPRLDLPVTDVRFSQPVLLRFLGRGVDTIGDVLRHPRAQWIVWLASEDQLKEVTNRLDALGLRLPR